MFRVPLAADEVDKYSCDGILVKEGTYVLGRTADGFCVYFDKNTKRCRIWDKRPKKCREYDCRKDPRLLALQTPEGASTFADTTFDGKLRLILSVAVLPSKDKRKTIPMMFCNGDQRRAVEVTEIIGDKDSVLQQVQQCIETMVNRTVDALKSKDGENG
jgi:hypothetical protein